MRADDRTDRAAAAEFVFGRVSWAARVIHRFSIWGATAGLVAGTVTYLAVLPLLPDIGDQWPIGALVLALVLVAAPLRGHVARAPHPCHLRRPPSCSA